MDVLVTVEHGNDLVEEVNVEGLCTFAMEQMELPAHAELSVTFVSNDEMARLNKEYRGMEGPTDVLSFPYQEFQEPGDFSGFSNCPQAFHPDYGELMLGDIVLSADHCISQAEEFSGITDITGIVLTKMDGTARGGISITITDEFDMPIKFIGVGEKMEDLVPFDAHEFVEGIFEEDE